MIFIEGWTRPFNITGVSSKIIEGLRNEPVVQFSVFTENKVGRLLELVNLLADHNVHVVALASLDASESSITRLVVDDPAAAKEVFQQEAIQFAETPLLVVEMQAMTDLRLVLAALLQTEINIHYIYPFIGRPKGKSALAIHLEDPELASQVLVEKEFRVLTQRDIAR
ncbi:MAG: ACT domain-containing protein [Candidatus Methylacidiphilales bacterium]